MWHSKIIRLLYITLTAITLLFAAYQANQYINRPKDLGSEVVYIGKETYGCWIPLCASKPTNEYLFGTDLSDQELAEYFGMEIVDNSKISIGTSQKELYLARDYDATKRFPDVDLQISFPSNSSFSGKNPKRHLILFSELGYKEALKIIDSKKSGQ